MTPDITPAQQARWCRARSEFGVALRRPEPDETPLSDAEILHGVRFGVFDGLDGYEPVYVLEKRTKEPA